MLKIFKLKKRWTIAEKNIENPQIMAIFLIEFFVEEINDSDIFGFSFLIIFIFFKGSPMELSVPIMKKVIICDMKRSIPRAMSLVSGIETLPIRKEGPAFTQKYSILFAVFKSIFFSSTSFPIRLAPAGYPHIKLKKRTGPIFLSILKSFSHKKLNGFKI